MSGRYLEDFAVGQTFCSGRVRVNAEEIKAFAAQFDPQPFHLDERAARDSMFKGLAASGWHTAALTMRLIVEGDLKPAGGVIGAGFDEFRWPRPVRPGDELHVEGEAWKRGRRNRARPRRDQGADNDLQPEQRSRADPDRQPCRVAAKPGGFKQPATE